jgi:hypothetical protein
MISIISVIEKICQAGLSGDDDGNANRGQFEWSSPIPPNRVDDRASNSFYNMRNVCHIESTGA